MTERNGIALNVMQDIATDTSVDPKIRLEAAQSMIVYSAGAEGDGLGKAETPTEGE
jgi:hypothetical protein